ncbi:SPOSA6832_03186, partial [Sporobolomyces salmonicolor]
MSQQSRSGQQGHVQQPIAPGQQGTFPILSVQDLLSDLQQSECPITPDDLNHPTPSRVQTVYEWWMNRLLGLNAEDIRRAAEAQLVQMDNPDIYREAMYMGVFRMAFNQLLLRCSIDDFTTKDLTAPTAKRFREVLSGIINFFFFASEQEDKILAPLEEELKQSEQHELELVERNAELKEKIEHERAQRQANKAFMDADRVSHERAVNELNQLRDAANSLKKQGEAEKADLLELSHTINHCDMAISELKGNIVSSPDKLQGAILDLSNQLARDQELLREHEAKERQTTGKINVLGQYAINPVAAALKQELQSCIRILDDWKADVDKLREAKLRLDEHSDDHRALQGQLSELENEIALLERRIANAREELLRLSEKAERKREQAKQRKRALEEQHVTFVERKRRSDMEGAEKNREAAEVEQQIRAMHASLQAELDKGEKAYKRIKDQVNLYSIRINKALDTINVVNSEPPQL